MKRGISAQRPDSSVPSLLTGGSVYGLDGALVSGARVIAPLAGASIAYWFSMRLTFTVTGVLYLLIFALVRWQLPRRPATVSTLA